MGTRLSAPPRRRLFHARFPWVGILGLAVTVGLAFPAAAVLPKAYAPGGVFHIEQQYWLPLEPVPVIARNPHEGAVPAAAVAVPRSSDIPPRPRVFIPANAYLECKDLGSTVRATLYWVARVRPVRLDTDRDGKPCEGWTWGNHSKPACELRALRDERAARMWVYHGLRYQCIYDGEYGYVQSPNSTHRYNGNGNGATRVTLLDGDEEPDHGNPIADTTFAHETGHQAQIGVSEAERELIMTLVRGLDTHNGWGGPGSYLQLPSESWAESWVRCMTPYPWRSDYVQIPCPYVKAALTNRPFPALPPQPSTSARVAATPISAAQAAE